MLNKRTSKGCRRVSSHAWQLTNHRAYLKLVYLPSPQAVFAQLFSIRFSSYLGVLNSLVLMIINAMFFQFFCIFTKMLCNCFVSFLMVMFTVENWKNFYCDQVLNKRVPFLMNSIVDFKEHFPQGNNDRPVSNSLFCMRSSDPKGDNKNCQFTL